MKAYVITSGSIFGLLALVHVWRVFEEGTLVGPGFILITVLAAGLSGWAWRLLRLMPRR